MSPKISIITVSYNQAEYIEENILSVIEQGYPNMEHIIIDACSNDDTIDILKKYSHLIWTSEPDNGQSDGLNKGFKKASGEIIGWINSDDKLSPGALDKVANFFMKNPTEIAVVGNQRIIDQESNGLRIIKSNKYTFDYLIHKAKGITQNSMFFKSNIFDKIGYLDESLHYAMDREFFIRITSLKNIIYIPETLAEFRLQPDSKTSEGTYKFSKELIRIRRKFGVRFYNRANFNDINMIITQTLRQIKWLRRFVQNFRKLISR